MNRMNYEGPVAIKMSNYLQVSSLSFVGTLLLLELLFCPFLGFHTPLAAVRGLTCSGNRGQMSVMFVIVLQEVKVCNLNPFPNKPWFLRVCSTRLLKTLWEKEKLLLTSNFSFSHSVFKPIQVKIITLANFISSSANAFNLDKSRILSSRKEFIKSFF